ncbi:aminoacyl-histidine dipeptidase [Alkalibacter mobilis]|uniref:aminoacyl-histidine dipeptidase n=1 Tax=Alkalibacter mobilis TaxID=2787712 RepID=UPI00189E89D1|nr:aminoacyl-histidine dipeptidase [Alkalibacter mobilis]MBF7095518.1 aminoacyl-histidine dipeptidase [Alkalibacter mobilis]
MREEFLNLEPEKTMEFFYDISQIPRGSGKEEEISKYLVEFAKDRNLFYKRDRFNNVLIKKPASKGRETHTGVVLQGHVDMVWEKNSDTNFDFESQPLDLYIDGDFIKAKGTTLGADNGIGVAMALAVLDSKDLDHPMIEAVFTVDEERGLTGALNFDGSLIEGKILINLDSEDDDEILTSCAGGIRINHHIELAREKNKELDKRQIFEIKITGLSGGHSGMDINKGRANANRLMGRLLYAIQDEMEANIISISGGSKDNAIPREAFCTLAVDRSENENFEIIIKEFQRAFHNEYRKADSGIQVTAKTAGEPTDVMMTTETTKQIIAMLLSVPNGVMSMSEDIEGMPVSSSNVGVVETTEDETVISIAARSSFSSKKEEIIAINKAISDQMGSSIEFTGDYPGWSYAETSPVRDLATNVYKKIFGEEPKIVAVHAGIECGIFGEKIPGLDMISIGPNIVDVHSPREKLSISSTQKTWKFLTGILKEVR